MQEHDRLAEPDAAPQPLVLLVRAAALDADEHPEAARVDGVAAGPAGELGERRLRHERDGAPPTVDARAAAAEHEPQRAAHVLGERLAEGALDDTPGYRPPVEVGRHAGPGLDLGLDDAATIGKLK